MSMSGLELEEIMLWEGGAEKAGASSNRFSGVIQPLAFRNQTARIYIVRVVSSRDEQATDETSSS